ncbi:type II toxin-antitoxin system RelE/ParE family toxin [Aquimarina agarilytica]|uniref:type II toxin-antitoxin system RelE/ParE family toxin n=1 Tax=Aquimarina agarilytica TaxID=1087449 RepID=UPI00028A34E1|nr:type II toxin-antitoxin system RelE/ParE family toxin [Aquimarina agarilytica]
MSYNVKLLSFVYSDLKEAKEWYYNKNQNLAKDFKKEVNKEIDYISKHPENYQKKYKELRQSLVPRFPYAIFYQVEESKKQIILFAVLHTRRNPEIARNRMKK